MWCNTLLRGAGSLLCGASASVSTTCATTSRTAAAALATQWTNMHTLAGQGQGQGYTAVAQNNLRMFKKQSESSFKRFYSTGGAPSTDEMVASALQTGVSPTDFALKHPTERISYDESGGHKQLAGDPSKRAFTYLVLTGGRFIYAAGLRMLVLKFILSMQASKDVLALASLEVDLNNIAEGSTVTMKWRGKPVFIKHRTSAEIEDANSVAIGELRDAQTDEERVLQPEWLVLVGVCTHLGCVPLADAGDYNGWFCPCHGSHYDVSGRIRKGPAPYNMEVPEYKFLEEDKLLIG